MTTKADKILKRIEKLEETQVFGSVPRPTGELLRFLILATKSKKVLELGCSLGYSAIWMALACRETGGHVYTTDISESRIKIAKQNLRDAEMENDITLIEEDIISVLSNWSLGEIDFVFMDAEKEQYLDYYKLLIPLLRKGGVVIADDVEKYKEVLGSFFEEVGNDPNVVTQLLDFDDGLMLIYKK